MRKFVLPGTGAFRIGRLSHVICGLSVLGLLVGCRESAPDDLVQEEETTEALVFVKTAGEETLNRSSASGNLYKLSPISPDGVVTPITNFVGARVSDPVVSFDGRKIMFSMHPPGSGSRNIYEINADGTSLEQITSGGGDDFDPVYLPDGRILFTSSRAGEMDEYNHSPAEHIYTCDADGSNVRRQSFNQSDDFDPVLLSDGHIAYTRWEHFGTFNRFPLFFTRPDGIGTFHLYGPHGRNFFHPQPTPDGRLIAIESTMVNEDAGPIAVLKVEGGPADPAPGDNDQYWDVLVPEVNPDGAPWAYGAFKYPFPLGGNRYVVSYTLPAAEDAEVDYALYTFELTQTGAGTPEDPATFTVDNLTYLYNDPMMNDYDAQLIAARVRPPVIESEVDDSVDWGVFLNEDVFNRGNDGQERPVRGVDAIDQIAVIAARPTMRGEQNTYSANEFEKRALIGFAPVFPDGSFRIKVPADTPISFATMDDLDRGFVVKRTWLSVRPGEEFDQCVGCHEDRHSGELEHTNPNPTAALHEPFDLNIPEEEFTIINYENDIGPIVDAKCVVCHHPEYVEHDEQLPDGTWTTVTDTVPPPAGLDLTDVPDTLMMGMGIFPRAYVNLSGESEHLEAQVVRPAFPRHSALIDAVLGVDTWSDRGSHPADEDPDYALTEEEKRTLNLWVFLGAQYK
jgi:hypothetical protein